MRTDFYVYFYYNKYTYADLVEFRGGGPKNRKKKRIFHLNNLNFLLGCLASPLKFGSTEVLLGGLLYCYPSGLNVGCVWHCSGYRTPF